MLNIGPQELILVLIVALVVVGPARLPELGRSIGKALRELRKVQDDVKDTFRFDANDDGPTRVTPRPAPATTRRPASTDQPEGAAAGEITAEPGVAEAATASGDGTARDGGRPPPAEADPEPTV
jgi:Tat protein translocase TatB subunit